jgi:hypothetical protein
LIKRNALDGSREAVTFGSGYTQAGFGHEAEQRKGGFMSIAEGNDPAAIDQTMEEITADSIRMFMRDVSATTMREISDLITELEVLRQRLLVDGSRAERQILEYARFGQSATQLATIASQSMVGVKQPTADR